MQQPIPAPSTQATSALSQSTHLGAVDDLGLARVEHFADLPRNQRLPAPRGPVEQDAADVVDAELLHQPGEDAGGERPSEHRLNNNSSNNNINNTITTNA